MTLLPARSALVAAAMMLSLVAAFSGTALSKRPAPAPTPAINQFGINLVVNGGAETQIIAGKGKKRAPVPTPPGWTASGDLKVLEYASNTSFLNANSPGPQDRGKRYFSGGAAPMSTAMQTISLVPSAKTITGGNVQFVLSGWLGGYLAQDDNAKVYLQFQDAHGRLLSGATIGPVLAAARNNVTGMLFETTSGTVPADAAQALVTLTLTRAGTAANHGCADNISLVLTKG